MHQYPGKGFPQVVRGPAPDIEDFTEIQLADGRYRGFVAGDKTYAIDGNPLYSCYSESEKSHFAANSPDYDHLGKREALLGYDLKE